MEQARLRRLLQSTAKRNKSRALVWAGRADWWRTKRGDGPAAYVQEHYLDVIEVTTKSNALILDAARRSAIDLDFAAMLMVRIPAEFRNATLCRTYVQQAFSKHQKPICARSLS